MKSKLVLHISESVLSLNSGMGRVVYYWKKSFEEKGFEFIHIGPEQIGSLKHPFFFPFMVYCYFRKKNYVPSCIIVHEPASGMFVNLGIPCFVESHGIEQRFWDMKVSGVIPGESPNIKTRFFFPLWRLLLCNKGLKMANKLLLINNDDSNYVQKKYKRDERDIFLFKNGINLDFELSPKKDTEEFTILFNGSWILRKGIQVLIESAEIIHAKGFDNIRYLLIGTGMNQESVLNDWPRQIRNLITVIPRFLPEEELGYLSNADIFVLPSYFEGQPLSLLQAMAAHKCCITTNCCGQKDIIDHGVNGLLFESGNANELAKLIENCFLNKSMVSSLGERAFETIKDRNWKTTSDDLVSFVINNI